MNAATALWGVNGTIGITSHLLTTSLPGKYAHCHEERVFYGLRDYLMRGKLYQYKIKLQIDVFPRFEEHLYKLILMFKVFYTLTALAYII